MIGLNVVDAGDNPVSVTVTQRLWLTADRSRLVVEGDPDAAFLFAIPGHRVPRADAIRYGIPVGGVPEPVDLPDEGITHPETELDQEPDVAVVPKPVRRKRNG